MTRDTLQQEVAAWFAARMPSQWFLGPPEVRVDHDEILVTGQLAPPPAGDPEVPGAGSGAEAQAIGDWRERTRPERMAIASEAERVFGRKVSWAARCGQTERLFTHASVPVMTRLRMAERQVLDTLVEAGVARSRSDALAWCVRLVAQHEAEWLDDLRQALAQVRQVRAEGPTRL
ncbi:MAG TPA: hypothetical protein VKY15_07425 [Acidimicrobiales bacterium]|jgi:hypothetical protein|nr:hypothetical protein [Acidimicrobiales bacterium]